MAERTISTRLIMQGEKEYRAQIAQINREYKTLESALKLLESQFKGQQNTLAALEAKHKALADVIAKQTEKYKTENAAIKQNQEYQKKAAEQAEAVRRQIEELNRSTSEADKKTEEYQKQLKELENALKKAESAEANAAANVEKHTAAANNAQVKLNNLNAALRENDKYLEEAKSSSDGCAKSIDSMGNAVKDSEKRFLELGEKGAASIDALASALAAAGVAGSLKEIAGAIKACLDSSIEFETAMTGVAKTTDMSGEELAAMSKQIQELSQRIPLTTTELAQIAEAGGQLGIAKEDLMAFTEVMAALGVSTNMASGEAAVMLAQFATITGLAPTMYSNLGSAIVDLGNNFATNEKKITEMSLAMAAGGKNARMSAPDILALSTAVTSLGIEATVGGNNMTELIGDMQLAVETGKDLDLWAKAAGMTAQEFAALWGKDATQAIVRFITALGTTEESARATLVALGQNDDRLVRMVTSLNAAEKETGLLTRALQASESAWIANTALMREAELRYSTTESKQQILANSINNLKIAVGDQLKPAMNELLEVGTDWAQWATDFVESNQQIVPVMTAVVAALGTFVGGLTLLAAVVSTAQKALAALNAVVSANPWVLAASAMAAVIVAIGTLAITSQEANAEVEALTSAQENLNTAMETAESSYNASVEEIEAQSRLVNELCSRLDELAAKSSLTAEEQSEQSRIVSQLNTLLPGLNASIDEQTGVLNTSTEAIRQQTQAWKEQQTALAVAELRQELVGKLTKAEIEYEKALAVREEREQQIGNLEAMRQVQLQGLAEALNVDVVSLQHMNAELIQNYKNGQDSAKGVQEYSEALEQQEAEFKVLMEALVETESDIADLTLQNEESQEAFDTLGDTVAEARSELEEMDEAAGKLIETSGEMPKAAETTANALAEQAEAYQPVIDRLGELREYQQKIQESTRAQVESMVSGFELMVPPAKQAVEDTIKALESQIVYMDHYGRLVKQAMELGYEKSLISVLVDAGEKGMAIMQGLIDDQGKSVEEVNEAWNGKLKQSEELATELADAKLKADEGYQALVDRAIQAANDLNQSDLAFNAGAATVQGLVNGLRSKEASLQSTINAINAITRQINGVNVGSGAKAGGGKTTVSSHAQGIEYVPYDGYLAVLHEGERVQTAMAARAQRALDMTNYGAMRRFERMQEAASTTNNSSMVINIYAQGSSRGELEKAADQVAARLRYKGVIT